MAGEKEQVDAYLNTIDRLEPDIAMIDAGAAYASAAISLKRIADTLGQIQVVKPSREVTPEMVQTACAAVYGLADSLYIEGSNAYLVMKRALEAALK